MTPPKECLVPGCPKSAHYKDWGKRGYCPNHYALLRRHGDPTKTVKAPNGAGSISCGYRKIYIDGEQVWEHRYLMEQYLGRKLKPFPEEVIHHINGDRLDNRIENLQVVSQSIHRSECEYHNYRDESFKTCSKCHKVLPRSAFSLDKQTKPTHDPHRPHCRACRAAYTRAYLAKKT
jgi:hypothetical protein